MKIKTFGTRKLAYFFSISSILLVFVLLYVYNMIAQDELHAVAAQEIEQIKKQLDVAFEDSIEESEDDLSLLASYVAKNIKPNEDVIDFLNTQSQTEEFENLYHVNLDGIGISTQRIERNFSKNSVFLSALKNEFILSPPYKSSITGEIVLDVAVPVIKDDKVITVLFSEHSIESLFERISELMFGIGYAYILSKDGTVLFSTEQDFIRLEELSDDSLKILSDSTFEEVLDDIKDGQSDILYYELDGKVSTVMYIPIKSADWTLVLTVNEDKIHSSLYSAVAVTIYLSAFAFIALIAFAFYIWYSSKIKFIRSIEKIAYTDSLTGLPNLACLKKDMEEILNKNPDVRYTIIKIDIENFKAINEIFNFHVGNEVLQRFKHIALVINEPSLIVARTGVDEFMCFFKSERMEDIDRITRYYEVYFKRTMSKLRNYNIAFKYGRYNILPEERDVNTIINNVNMAHTMAKEQKGYKICDYDDKYKERILKSIKVSNQMKHALKSGEFQAFLQPKISVIDETLIGAEALVRWIEPNGNIILPEQYIPIFEKNGFIVNIDRYMLETVCATLKKWNESGCAYLPISVNLSRLNLSDANLAKNLAKIVNKYNIPHNYIEFELTESTMIDNESILEALFNELHSYNFRVSIDDFGSGYSSLSLLKNLSVDTIKLDKSFFADKKHIERGNLIVNSLIQLAHSLNIHIVAEGIEELHQLQFIKNSGGDAIQGYYYAKPMSIADFEEKYTDEMKKI